MEKILPFKNPADGFNLSLFRDYLSPLAQWFFEASDNGVFLRSTNSAWESAYAVNYLIALEKSTDQQLRKYLPNCDFSNLCKKQATNTIEWLITSPRVIEIEIDHSLFSKSLEKTHNGYYHLYCWEKNTWDTSVIINSVIGAVDFYGISLIKNHEKDVEKVILGAIAWLLYEFDEQKKEYSSYAFGSNDFAPILSVLVSMLESKWIKTILGNAYLKYKSKIINMAKRMVQYFYLCEETVKTKVNGVETVVGVHWGDNFITSEIATALVKYFSYLTKHNKNSTKEITQVYDTLKKVCYWFEVSQTSDGLWGSHDDTMQSLRTYLRVTSCIKKYELNRDIKDKNKSEKTVENSIPIEDHKIFKSIRWLLDEKQCVNDKSYLHTSYLTVFFAQLLVTVFREWSFSKNYKGEDKNIFILYDELIGIFPTQTATERAKNVQLEIEKNELKNLINEKKEIMRTIIIISFFVLGICITICSLFVFNVLELTPGRVLPKIQSDERLFGIIDVISMILTIILTYFVFHKFNEN